MDSSYLVFALASSACFFPIYWTLKRLFGGRQDRQLVQVFALDNDEARHEFLDCLRREIIARVDAALQDAVKQRNTSRTSVNGRHVLLDRATLERLSDARRMMKSLFPATALLAFDEIVTTLKQTENRRQVDLSARIVELKTVLDDGLGRRVGVRTSMTSRALAPLSRAFNSTFFSAAGAAESA